MINWNDLKYIIKIEWGLQSIWYKYILFRNSARFSELMFSKIYTGTYNKELCINLYLFDMNK